MEPVQHEPAEDEFVPVLAAGTQAAGQYQCASCRYGIALHSRLPLCPMCGSEAWKQVAWVPFSQALAPEHHS